MGQGVNIHYNDKGGAYISLQCGQALIGDAWDRLMSGSFEILMALTSLWYSDTLWYNSQWTGYKIEVISKT